MLIFNIASTDEGDPSIKVFVLYHIHFRANHKVETRLPLVDGRLQNKMFFAISNFKCFSGSIGLHPGEH